MLSSKLTGVALFFLAPWVRALQLQVPVDWETSTTVNISWTNTQTDPAFTLQLVNLASQISYSVANVLDPAEDFASFTLRVVPEGVYNLRAVSVTNTVEVFNETPTFSVRPPPPPQASTTEVHSDSTTSSGSQLETSISSSRTSTTQAPTPTSTSASRARTPAQTPTTAANDSATSESTTLLGSPSIVIPTHTVTAMSTQDQTPYLSTPAIVGMVAGVGAVTSLLALALFSLLKRWRRLRTAAPRSALDPPGDLAAPRTSYYSRIVFADRQEDCIEEEAETHANSALTVTMSPLDHTVQTNAGPPPPSYSREWRVSGGATTKTRLPGWTRVRDGNREGTSTHPAAHFNGQGSGSFVHLVERRRETYEETDGRTGSDGGRHGDMGDPDAASDSEGSTLPPPYSSHLGEI